MSTPRAAVIGGNRIPFARANSRYAQASNQDMLVAAALDGLVARFGLQDERLGEGRGRGRAQARARLQPDPRDRPGLPTGPDHARLRHPAGLWHRPGGHRCWSPTRLRWARSRAVSPGGADSISDAPVAVNEDFRQVLLAANRARSAGARIEGAQRVCVPGQLKPSLPEVSEPRTGHVDGRACRRSRRRSGDISRAAQDELALASHRNLAAAYDQRLLRRPDHALSGPDPRPEPASGLVDGEAGPASGPVFGRGRRRDDDGGQLDPADRRRVDGVCWAATNGPRRTTCLCWPILVDAETGAVDFLHGDRKADGLLMAPVYALAPAAGAPEAERCRTSTTTRFTRLSPRPC